MKIIYLTKGYATLVDDEDYEYLNKLKWCAGHSSKGQYYAKRTGGALMHRVILNAPKELQVDHINGNKLDNRKSNLRLCTVSQNLMNKKKYCGESPYKGVHFNKRMGRYEAYIKLNARKIHIGHFDTPQEAALAWNKKAIELYGEFALLNEVL